MEPPIEESNKDDGSNAENEPENYYESLIKEAPFLYGDHGISPIKLDLPHSDLNDPQLIAQGKDFVRRNFYPVMLAHLISLMWIFTFKPGRAVLLRTGESHNKEASLKRYLSTVLHIKLWYESDFIERSASGSQDLYSVRKMHAAAAKNYDKAKPPAIPPLTQKQKKIMFAIRKQLESMDTDTEAQLKGILNADDPDMPMSQFDMVITQFCFIGFIILMPQTFGIHDTKGMDGFVHLWAIFGRSLGIEDRFNLAIHYKNSGGDLTSFWRIYRDIFVYNLKEADETAMVMWDSLIYGCSKYVRQLRLMPMIKFMVVDGTGGTDTGALKPVMNVRDAWSYNFLLFATHKLSKYDWARKARNRVIRVSFCKAQKKYLPRWGNSNGKKGS